MTLLFSAISLVAGVILAYNALLLASDERRRFIVYLIETGTPDSMIVASLAFDALILGVAGSLLGLLAGDAHLADRLPHRARLHRGRVRRSAGSGSSGLPTVLIALGGRHTRGVRRGGPAGDRRSARERGSRARRSWTYAFIRTQTALLGRRSSSRAASCSYASR